MSSGGFVYTRYLRDNGADIHPIKVQPETTADWNDPPALLPTSDISAMVSSGRRKLGLHARTITLKMPDTGQPAGYKPGGLIRLPIFQLSEWNAIQKGTQLLYLGVQCFVVGKQGELAR